MKDVVLEKNEKLEIEKSISFKPITTRALHLGLHHIEVVSEWYAQGKKIVRADGVGKTVTCIFG